MKKAAVLVSKYFFGSILTFTVAFSMSTAHAQELSKSDSILDAVNYDSIYRGGVFIDIKSIDAISEDEVLVYVSATTTSGKLGFGDGTVETEKITIKNPPLYVPTGELEKIVNERTGEEYYVDEMQYDPSAAFESVLSRLVMDLSKTSEIVEIGKVGRSVLVVYPAADGIFGSGENVTWSVVRDATTALYQDTTDNAPRGYINADPKYNIERNYYTFDTSSIGSATIGTTSLFAYGVTAFDSDNDAYATIGIVDFSPASEISLTTADYNNFGFEWIGDVKDITGMSTGAYHEFAIHATNTSVINTSGVTSLGLMEGHDKNNNAYSSATYTGFRFRHSSNAGTTQDPYLLVNYTSGGGGEETPTSTATTTSIDFSELVAATDYSTQTRNVAYGMYISLISFFGIIYYFKRKTQV